MKEHSRRPGRARRVGLQPGRALEALEGRVMLSRPAGSFGYYQPERFRRTVDTTTPTLFESHPIGSAGPRRLSFLDNDSKVISGKDREGDEYTITVHGPGIAIVTDATPNDGVLDDDIDTIQLVGTDINNTFVTAQTTASGRVITDGTVFFNRLLAQDGVASIILNGFTLAQTVAPVGTDLLGQGPEIALLGGVRQLQFHNIVATFDQAFNPQPFDIVIGDPTTALTVEPIIRLDSIFNTVINSSVATIPNGIPQTRPTVNILVNGQIRALEIISSTAVPIDAGFQPQFPTVSITGKTAVRALGIDGLKVVGSARNFTASRGAVPFQDGFSGLNRLGHAYFGGPADGVGLDVTAGRIGRLKFLRGLGDPDGLVPPDTNLGTPASLVGYPFFGLLGGQIAAQSIGAITAGPQNLVLQTSQDPHFIQDQTTGSTRYFSRPGDAGVNAAIAAAGSIGGVNIVGNLRNSQINAGFDFPSYVAGLDPTRSPSRIGPYRQRGDLVGSVVAASYRPVDGTFGTPDDVAGNGTIQGNLDGSTFQTGRPTALYGRGAGFFARTKIGYLPPPEAPKRFRSVLFRV